MAISPLQLAVVLVGIFIIVSHLIFVSQVVAILFGVFVIILAVLPGFRTGGWRVVRR